MITAIMTYAFWRGASGRVKIGYEADDFCALMKEFDRLRERPTWIDVSFVERDRMPH